MIAVPPPLRAAHFLTILARSSCSRFAGGGRKGHDGPHYSRGMRLSGAFLTVH
jgi:hypothetical protein